MDISDGQFGDLKKLPFTKKDRQFKHIHLIFETSGIYLYAFVKITFLYSSMPVICFKGFVECLCDMVD